MLEQDENLIDKRIVATFMIKELNKQKLIFMISITAVMFCTGLAVWHFIAASVLAAVVTIVYAWFAIAADREQKRLMAKYGRV